MPTTLKVRALLITLILAIIVTPFSGCRSGSDGSSGAAAEAQHVALAVLSAESRGDADTVFKLWDPFSPERMSRRRHLLEPSGVREIGAGFKVKEVQLTGDKANATFVLNSGSSVGDGLHRLELIRIDGNWRAHRQIGPDDAVADKVLSSSSKQVPAYGADVTGAIRLRRALVRKGEIFEAAQKLDQAQSAWEIALAVATASGDNVGASEALWNLGNLNIARGKPASSIDLLNQAMARLDGTDALSNRAAVLATLGRARYTQSMYRTALGHLEAALAEAHKLRDKVAIARALLNISAVRLDLGQYTTAGTALERAISLAAEMDDPAVLSRALHNLGDLHIEWRDFPAAISYLERSLTMKRRAKEWASAANTLHSIGVAYLYQGNHDKAIATFNESLRLAQEGQDEVMVAYVEDQIGSALARQGNLDAALAMHQASLATSQKTGERSMVAAALLNLSYVLRQKGQFASALTHAQQSSALAAKLDSPELLRQARASVAELGFRRMKTQ